MNSQENNDCSDKEQVLRDTIEANHQKMSQKTSEEITQVVDDVARMYVKTSFNLRQLEIKDDRDTKARNKGNFITTAACQYCGKLCNQKANSPHLIDHLCDDCKPSQRQGPPKKLKGGYMNCRGCEKRRIWSRTGLCPPCFAEKV